MEAGAQELACAEKWPHQDHFADLLDQIVSTLHLQDCQVSGIDGDGAEVGAQELS